MRLTSERCSGIKTGYWSTAKKEELVQKLGEIEHHAPRLIKTACDKKCIVMDKSMLQPDTCFKCELYKLAQLIGGVDPVW